MTMTTNPKKYRVLNLIAKVNMSTAKPKQWAVIRLLKWQPEAAHIRFQGRCHQCRCEFLLSYQTALDYDRGQHEETCGYYCPRCGWGNAGARPRRLRHDELGTEDTSR
jgi:hypothetical protein